MTAGQMILVNGLYLAAFIVTAYLTRAKVRRIAGALAGGAVFGVVAVLAFALGESEGWWRMPKTDLSHFELLLWLGFGVSCAPVYLVTWRVARRFGAGGLAVCVVAAALIGPPRDYLFAATFPEWMTFSPGFAPILAVSVTYALLVIVGHAAMRVAAGPARADSLARLASDGEANRLIRGIQ